MLGTAQFGLPYGIANPKGQTSRKEVLKIIKHAHETGINQYDTAAIYGESELRLGLIFKELGISKYVSVYTKIKPLSQEARKSEKDSKKAIITSLDDSLKRLKMECISGVFFHREKDVIYLEILQH